MAYERENFLMPEFPRTAHMPSRGNYKPNAASDDKIADEVDASVVLNNPNVYVEEKIDAANSGICVVNGEPIIRNRNHILSKGYGRKRTPAKLQFTAIWNWYYENADKFEMLNNELGFEAACYGEWMYQQHTIFYDKLPAMFIPFDIYDAENNRFVSTPVARSVLERVGFACVPLLQVGVKSWDELIKYFVQSPWAAEPELQTRPENVRREGVYLKVCDNDKVLSRFKMVRDDYMPGEAFSNEIKKNKVKK